MIWLYRLWLLVWVSEMLEKFHVGGSLKVEGMALLRSCDGRWGFCVMGG